MKQLVFDLAETEPPWLANPQPIFFCIRPTAQAASDAARIGRELISELGCRAKKVARERLHISLQGLGDGRRVPDGVVFAACRAAEQIAFAPFEAAFENVLTLRSGGKPFPSALMGFNADIRAFNDMLRQRLAANGLSARGAVNPHMTLFYAPEPVVPRPIEPIRFHVHELVLIRSIHGRGEHHLLGRWPLRAC